MDKSKKNTSHAIYPHLEITMRETPQNKFLPPENYYVSPTIIPHKKNPPLKEK